MSDDLITIVLADDHALMRGGLRALLATARDMQVVGEAGDGATALAVAERLHPDVLVLDLEMPGMDGLETMRELTRRQLATRVLVLTAHTEEEQLVQLLHAGAAGYLTKTAAQRELVDAIRLVSHGDVYVRPAAATVLARNVAKQNTTRDERTRFATLSEREQAVLRRVAQGYAGTEIGDQLGISPKTVETYKQRISEKLELRHRSEYVRFAHRLGLLEES